MLPSSAVNERGFWESERVNALNDELFAELGTTWHGLDPIAFGDLSKRRVREAQLRARTVLAEEFDEGVKPLIKDPRLSRLLPFWLPAITSLCAQTVYAIVLRSPVEVAQSLAKRNDFDRELGYLLWARYYLDAEFHTRGLPRVLINYDNLIGDWRATLGRLAGVGVELTFDPGNDAAVEDYLSVELRHHRTIDEQVFLDVAHLPVVQQTYRAFLAWSHDNSGSGPDCEEFDRAREQFDGLSGMLTRVVEGARLDRKRLTSARSQADATAAELVRARRATEDLAALRASQFAMQARLEERLDSVATSLTKAIQERSVLEQLVADSRNEAQQQRSALESALEESENAKQELRSKIDQLGQRLGEVTSNRDETRTELKEVKRKYRSTQHQLSRDQEKLRRIQERLAQVDASLAQIKETTVWRSYCAILATVHRCLAPLRSVFGISDRKLRTHNASLIRASHLFDGNWYLGRYSDVAAAGIDPAVHYLENGWREGRDPSQSFSTTSYLRLNSDVARAGLNPLLHFIEFGYSEGRSVSELAPSPSISSIALDEEFGPANPCASFSIRTHDRIRWRRAARLSQAEGDLLTVGGEPIGILSSSSQRREMEGAFRRLQDLSGFAQSAGSSKTRSDRLVAASQLLDAWYVNHGQLRVRWRQDAPLVIRAYQLDNTKNGELSMVGEGISVSPLDPIDLNLRNPYFPVLFVLSDPDGKLRGFEFLAFPSLCRGGLHYPELLALDQDRGASDAASIDIVGLSEILADKLIKVTHGSRPFIAKLLVELAGADGTEGLFQPDLQAWLSGVLRIGMDPKGGDREKLPLHYLSAAATVAQSPRKSGGTLILPADAIPAISVLVMEARDKEAQDETELPVLIAGADPAEPVTLIKFPGAAWSTSVEAPGYPAVWPRLTAMQGVCPAEPLCACAVRYPKWPIPADSELLMPVAPPALPLREGVQGITWLVFPEDWNEDALREGLQALSLQIGTSLALVGEVGSSTISSAQDLFKDRVRVFADVMGALGAIETPLVGYMGAQIVLHDARTSQVLSALLEDSAVISASCVLVSADKHGKGWSVSVADPGLFSGKGEPEHSLSDRCHQSQLFWRTTYPALRPPRDLWVAKSASVAGWLQRAGPLGAEEGVQLCTSLVTASYIGERHGGQAHLTPPAAAQQRAIRSETLFG
jgi:hypothetical protein